MREVVGFIQLACALTLGMAGGWAVQQMGLVMGWGGPGTAARPTGRLTPSCLNLDHSKALSHAH